MTQILLWELRQRKAAIIWWTVGIAILVTALMFVYPSIRDQAGQLEKVLNQLPAGLRELKTGSSSVDVSSPIGYLNSQIYYATLPLFFIILAITRGSGLLGRDEQNHTLELLLSRPLSRGKLLLGKALSGIIELAVVATGATLVIAVLAPVVGMEISTVSILITSLFTFLFCLSFGAISFALTAFGRVGKHVNTAIAVIAGFGGYLLASLSGLTTFLETPAKFAPYHYFAPEQILHGHVNTGLYVYLTGIFVLTTLIAYFGFRRRDIS